MRRGFLRRAAAILTAAILAAAGGPRLSAQENPASATGSEPDLLIDTLELDIRTASYYELLAWAERLDLPTRGSRSDLQARLRLHYGVEAPAPPSDSGRESRPITIESANSTTYYTLEETGEDYVELNGNVVLTMRDEKSDSVHTIEADRIVYNQDRNELTASGSLTYTLTQPDKTEVFRGDSLSFSLDDWQGVFSNGTSTADRSLEENTVTFFYSGETIYRLADDIILLHNGTITSSDPEDPYYRIDATSIRILAPQEWALEDAVLYVGHVPMFYFPFFFHPGDELLMHPSVGLDDIQGYFLQTTTYLVGAKRDSSGSLSFLRVTEETSGSYETEREGLFLKKVSRDGRQGDQPPPKEDYLKILADVYSRHGLFVGLDGKFGARGILRTFDLLFGVARSRNISELSGGGYSYLEQAADGTFASVWNTGSFFGVETPLRYGGSGRLGVGAQWFNLDLNLAAHSDPFVSRDFFDRKEEIDWAKLLGIEEEQPGTGAGGGKRTDSYQWKLASRLTLQSPGLAPYIQTAQLSRLDFSLNWRAKTRPDSDFGADATFEPLGYRYPDRYFFFPESMSAPSAVARVAGTLFRRTFGGAPMSAGGGRPDRSGELPELRPPWALPGRDGEKAPPPAEPPLRVPEPIDAAPVPRRQTVPVYDHQLSYTIAPEVTLDTRFNSGSWLRPSDIRLFDDSSNEYSLFSGKTNAQLSYRGSLYRSALTMNESFAFQGTLREHFDPIDPDSDGWRRLIEQDRSTTLLRSSNAIGLVAKPLFFADAWSDSTVSYDLATTVFRRTFDSDAGDYANEWAEWSPDFVTTHTLTLSGKYDSPVGVQSLSTTVKLPPADPVVDLRGVFVTGVVTTTATAGFEKPDSWKYKPITLTERIAPELPLFAGSYLESGVSYDPEERLFGESTSSLVLRAMDGLFSLNQTLRYDIEEKRPVESLTALHIAFFDARFTAARTMPLEFVPTIGWRSVPDSEDVFLPSLASFSLRYSLDKRRFWKDRVEVSGNLTSAWNLNLLRVTDSSLSLEFRLSLRVAEFLDLNFTSRSEQRGSYRYVPALSEKVGLPWLNPIEDIAKSINFFYRRARIESDFNLSSITLDAVHYLRDWELSVNYTGKPIIRDEGEGNRYVWDSSFSIFVRWYPIPEIKREVTYSDGDLGI